MTIMLIAAESISFNVLQNWKRDEYEIIFCNRPQYFC